MTSELKPDLDAEYRQLREECGSLRRRRTTIAVVGPDAAEFLQGQVTSEVEGLAIGNGCYGALLDRKGHIQADMRILRRSEDVFLIDAPEQAGPRLLRHLTMYTVGRDVAVSESDLQVISLIGPASNEVSGLAPGPEFAFAEARLAGADCLGVTTDLGLDVICPAADVDAVDEELAARRAVPVSEDAAEIVRIESGRPRFETEMTAAPMPAESGIVERAVSFTKGCYIGQEPVARLHYRGKPNRHLRGLKLDGPVTAGDPVRIGERELGTIGSHALSPASGRIALAILRKEAGPGDRVTIEATGGQVEATVTELPFVGDPGL